MTKSVMLTNDELQTKLLSYKKAYTSADGLYDVLIDAIAFVVAARDGMPVPVDTEKLLDDLHRELKIADRIAVG